MRYSQTFQHYGILATEYAEPGFYRDQEELARETLQVSPNSPAISQLMFVNVLENINTMYCECMWENLPKLLRYR